MNVLICTQKMDKNDSVLGFTHRWVLEFAKRYDTVTVVCLYKGAIDLPANVRVLSLGKENGVSRLTYLKLFFLYIFKEQQRYDHVFVHMNQVYVLLGFLFWRMWGKRIGFWYAHGHVPFSARVAVHCADFLFTSTAHGYPIESKKRTIVGQGIATDVFACERTHPHSDNAIRLVSAGRLSPIKNYEVVIEALRILTEKGVRAELSIVGGADTDDQKAYEQTLRATVSTYNLEQSVTFVGPVPNHELKKYFCAADLFVNAGQTGSLDKVGLEAIASGLAVLTCNPAYEVIFEAETERFFFEAHDAQMLATKIEKEAVAEDLVVVVQQLQKKIEAEHSIGALVLKIKDTLTTR